MAAAQSYPEQVKLLRSWGCKVVEEPGCYGRSNGSSWRTGDRIAQLNHHYVCPLSPPGNVRAYVDSMRNGKIVNWVIDAAGVIYLIGTGPMSHAGKGDGSVNERMKKGQAPVGWHPPSNAFEGGNRDYDGVELLHPGDNSPYPDAMINATVALNASRCLVLKQSANTAIMHGEHTNRKIDMSWRGGSSGDGATELRKRVAARMTGGSAATPAPKPPAQPLNLLEWIMTLPGAPTGLTYQQFLTAVAKEVWETRMPTHSSIVDGKEAANSTSIAKNTLAGIATNTTRTQLKK